MIKFESWNIYTYDGEFLGRHSAFAPETAVCMHLALSGHETSEKDLKCRPLGEDIHEIADGDRHYYAYPADLAARPRRQ